MKFKKITIYTLVLSLFLIPAVGRSDNASDSTFGQLNKKTSEEVEEMKADKPNAGNGQTTNTQAKKEGLVEDKCNRLTVRVQNKIETAKGNHERHQNRYLKMVERLENLIARLQDAEYDTTGLEDGLAGLDPYLADLAAAHDAFIAALEESEDYVCGESEGGYAMSLKSAKEELKAVREALKELRTYFINEVKPELAAVKAEIQVQKRDRDQVNKPEDAPSNESVN